MRRQDWAFYISAGGAAGALALAWRSPRAALVLAGAAVTATVAAKLASRRHPEPLHVVAGHGGLHHLDRAAGQAERIPHQ